MDELATAVSERLDVLDRTTAHSDDRHRSMNAVIESSIARLDEQTGAMLHRLATFAGSFTQSLAEAFTPWDLDMYLGPGVDETTYEVGVAHDDGGRLIVVHVMPMRPMYEHHLDDVRK